MAKKAGKKTSKKEKVDKGIYEAMKPYFKAALEYVLQTGRTVGEFFEFVVGRFGAPIIPYLQRFMREVRDGTVKIAGLTKETRDKVLGEKFDPIAAGKKALLSIKSTAEKEIHVVKDVVSDWLSGSKKSGEAAKPTKAPKKAATKKVAAKKKAAPRKTAAKKKAANKRATVKKAAARKKAARAT